MGSAVNKTKIQPAAAIKLGIGYIHIRNGNWISGRVVLTTCIAMICPKN